MPEITILKKTDGGMQMKPKKYAVVDQRRCVACGECVRSCRRGAICIVGGCYAFANRENCVGCGLCSRSCPAGCIEEVPREEDQQDA